MSINTSIFQLYQHWANSILCEVGIVVDNIEEFQNGALLAVLVDLLWPDAQLQKKLQEEGLGEELNQETALQCTCAVLNYVQEQGIKISLSAKEIVEGDVKSLLDLLWVLILHFTIHNPDVANHLRTVKAGKRKILEWCGQHLDGQTFDPSKTLAANICQNGYVTRLISQICEVEVSPDPIGHLTNALVASEEQLGISKHILDPISLLHGNIEEHSLLVYVALLRRKAQLIEDLAPHEQAANSAAAGVVGGAPVPGMNQQWSSYPIPPEAMEAMGIDASDYVMYAIVEEHFIPPEAMGAYPSPYDQVQMFGANDKASTVKISEIFSEDEAGSVRDSGADSPRSRKSEGAKVTRITSMCDSGPGSGDDSIHSYFMEKNRAEMASAGSTLQFQKHKQFPDAGHGDGRPINPVPWIVESSDLMNGSKASKGTKTKSRTSIDVKDDDRQDEEVPTERSSTRAPKLSMDSSTDMSGEENNVRSQIRLAEKEGKKKKKPPRSKQKPRRQLSESQQQQQEDEVNDVINNSEMVRASIAHLINGMSDGMSDGMGDRAGHVAPSLEEGLREASGSDEDIAATMTAMRQLLTSKEIRQLAENSEGHMPVFALDGSMDSSRLHSLKSPASDFHGLPSSVDGEAAGSDSAGSCEAVRNGSPPSSLDVSQSGDDLVPAGEELLSAGDELLDLLDRIGQQGVDMRNELDMAYAREVVLTHSKINEDDSTSDIIGKLKAEIEALQSERDSALSKSQGSSISGNDQHIVSQLQNTITDLRGKLAKLKTKSPTKKPACKSVGTLTERLITVNEPTQTLVSFYQLRNKSVQTECVGMQEQGVQVKVLPAVRSRFTSTADFHPLNTISISCQTSITGKIAAVTSHMNGRLSPTDQSSFSKVEDTPADSSVSHSEVTQPQRPGSPYRPKGGSNQLLNKMMNHVHGLNRGDMTSDQCDILEKLAMLETLAEDVDKWQEMSSLAIDDNPILAQLQRSLACATFQNRLLQADLNKQTSSNTDDHINENDVNCDMELSLTPVTQSLQGKIPGGNGVMPELGQLKDRIISLERTLTNAQVDNSKLTSKLEEALQTVKENLMMSPERMSSFEHGNQVLMKRLVKVEHEKSDLEEDLHHLKASHSKSASAVSTLESSVAGAQNERHHLRSEVNVLREEYDYIKRGMEMMESFLKQEESSGGHNQSQTALSNTSKDERLKQLVEQMEQEMSRRDSQKHTTHQASPDRGRTLTKTKKSSPTTQKDDISSKVQKELDKRFPRSRSNSSSRPCSTSRPGSTSRAGSTSRSPSANSRLSLASVGDHGNLASEDKCKDVKDYQPLISPRKKPEEVKPLVDAVQVRDMSVDELRKKRLALLIESYTSHTDLGSFGQNVETPPQNDGAARPPSRRGSVERLEEQHPDGSLGHRRKLPYIPKQKAGESVIVDQTEYLSLPQIRPATEPEFLSLPERKPQQERVGSSETKSASTGSRPYFMRARRQTASASTGHANTRSSLYSTTDSGVSDLGGTLENQSSEDKPDSHSRDSSLKSPRLPSSNAKGPFLQRSVDIPDIVDRPPPRSAWSRSRSNPRTSPNRSTTDKAPWRRSTQKYQTTSRTESQQGNGLTPEESDAISTSSSVRGHISSLNERSKPDGTTGSRDRISPESSDNVFHSPDDNDVAVEQRDQKSVRDAAGSRISTAPSFSTARRKKLPPWKQYNESKSKPVESSDSSTDKSEEYWKEPRRYDYRYGRRQGETQNMSSKESFSRTAPWASKPRDASPLLSSAPLPEIKHMYSSRDRVSTASPRSLRCNTQPNVRTSSASRASPRGQKQPTLLDDPGNIRSYRGEKTNAFENNSVQGSLTNSSQTSELSGNQHTYADELVSRYTNEWRNNVGVVRGPSDMYEKYYSHTMEGSSYNSRRSDSIYSNESDYMSHLLEKYSGPTLKQ